MEYNKKQNGIGDPGRGHRRIREDAKLYDERRFDNLRRFNDTNQVRPFQRL